MYKFLAPLFLGIFTLISTPQVQAGDKDVYRINCLPEVGVMEIKRYNTSAKGQTNYFSAPAEMEEKGYHNPLWELGRPDMYTHQCIINGQQVLVKMDALSYTEEKHGRPCAWDEQSTLRINAWVDGEQVIDSLRFDGGCTKSRAFLGENIAGISIHPFTVDTKISDKASEVWIGVEVLTREGYLKKRYGIDFSLPYGKGARTLQARPLTNSDVHGADIEENFPPDLQAP